MHIKQLMFLKSQMVNFSCQLFHICNNINHILEKSILNPHAHLPCKGVSHERNIIKCKLYWKSLKLFVLVSKQNSLYV